MGEAPPSASHALVTRYGEQIWLNLTTLIRQAQDEGRVVQNVDPRELAFALTAVIQGLSLNQALYSHVVDTFPSTETILRILQPCQDLPDARR